MGVMHDLGAVKGGTQHRGMRDFAAKPAADAAFADMRDGVALKRIRIVLDRQRRASG